MRDLTEYERYHKGYKSPAEDFKDSEQIDQYNEALKSKYDLDPRVFWNNSDHAAVMESSLRDFALFILLF